MSVQRLENIYLAHNKNPPTSPAHHHDASALLTAGLGNALDLVLFLDGKAVDLVLRGIHDLIGEALGDGLERAEGGGTGAHGHVMDGNVGAAKGGYIHGLTTRDTSGTNSGGVFAGSGVHNGVDVDYDGVFLGHDVYEVEAVLDDTDGHDLLAGVAAC
eukprot:1394014-Amorphochlora_amoeboformis.AAC.1